MEDGPEELGQHDQSECHRRTHTERARRAHLRRRHRAQPAAERLGEIACVIERDTDEQRREGIDENAKRAQPEIRHVDLEQRRRVARAFDPGCRRSVQQLVRRIAPERQQDARDVRLARKCVVPDREQLAVAAEQHLLVRDEAWQAN